MISVDDALTRIFDLLSPVSAETIPLRQATGRVMSGTATACLTQPPFDASAMDGYAIPFVDARPGDSFDIRGESAAGRGFRGTIDPGQAVRIFTGAPVPDGAKRVVIQEDVVRSGGRITLGEGLGPGLHIRPVGQDFQKGQKLDLGKRLRPVDLALLAAAGHANVSVNRKPIVAIIATGDELVAPGETPDTDQIIASNNLGLAAMIEDAGGIARLLPVARDTEGSLSAMFDLARGADLIVTIGGASVGDHDMVARVASQRGLERSFYKIAMRPGKPLMAGRLDDVPMIGLPGNPVSSMVCGEVFVRPALDVLAGLPAGPRTPKTAMLAHDIPANGPRAHYMRASVHKGLITPAGRQDSALLSVLAAANALMIRPVDDPSQKAGASVNYIPI